MDHPLFWSLLAGVALLVMVTRLVVGRPLLPRRAVILTRADLALAAVCVLALGFHCGAMFFAPWTDALPGGRNLGGSVRAMGSASEWAYWVPAAGLMLALSRITWPALVLLGATLFGVGMTMFRPSPLDVHLAWIATAVLVLTLISSSLIGRPASSASTT